MPALRVGYVVGDARLLDYVDRFLVPGSSISIAVAARRARRPRGRGLPRRQVAAHHGERERLRSSLLELGLGAYASRGNFVAVDCSARDGGALGLAAAVLAHGVVVRPLGDLLRISIGRREENDALVAALTDVV